MEGLGGQHGSMAAFFFARFLKCAFAFIAL